MQQPQQMMPMMPSFPASNVTTEQIQKYLDDNKKLILAILDNQNLGKLAECAQYQAQLQRNLMYLAAIADAQPQAPTMPQMAAMQQGPYYMQHPQAAMSQQGGMFSGKVPFQSTNPLHVQEAMLLHQQAIQGQLGMRPMMQSLYSDGPKDGRLGPKHDAPDADCRGNSAAGDSNGEWK